MNAQARANSWQKQARLRGILSGLLIALPLFAAYVLLCMRIMPSLSWPVAWLFGVLALLVFVLESLGHFDRTWLIRQLDSRRPELENSSDLLFEYENALGMLQMLQRRRVDRKSTRLNSSHVSQSRMPSSA